MHLVHKPSSQKRTWISKKIKCMTISMRVNLRTCNLCKLRKVSHMILNAAKNLKKPKATLHRKHCPKKTKLFLLAL